MILNRLTLTILMIALAATVSTVHGQHKADLTQPGQIIVLDISGPIGPATRDYVVEGIDQADESSAELVIIRMDTPGGLADSMRDIIKRILNARTPVATWVGPAGSRAASAGTYILYASHVSAMAPSTNLGAATPVAIGGGQQPASPARKAFERLAEKADEETESESDESAPASPEDAAAPSQQASGDKAVEDAVAYIRSLAEQHGRNADWAESAVRSAASLSSQRALEQNVIDFVAADIDDLLIQLEGHEVVIEGVTRRLTVADKAIVVIEPTLQHRILAIITNPTLAYILLLIGVYGLVLEGYNPGALVPGVIGGICLLLALYAFQILPVNFAGLALILLGFALIAVEFFVPSFGILGVGGIVALTFGSIILMDTDVPGFGIPIGLISGVAITAGVVFAVIMFMLARAYRKPVVSGVQMLIGRSGDVLTVDSENRLRVHVSGEDWSAVSSQRVRPGDQVMIASVDGLTLTVEPMEESHD